MQTNMTIKGQVTIPRDVRRATGLVPGKPVLVEMNDRGEAVVRPVPFVEKTREQQVEDYLARVSEVQADFRKQDQMPGIDPDEWYAWVRGPAAEV